MERGAAAAKEGGATGTRDASKPVPWSQLVFGALLNQLLEQGLDATAPLELSGVDIGRLAEAVPHSEPLEEPERACSATSYKILFGRSHNLYSA